MMRVGTAGFYSVGVETQTVRNGFVNKKIRLLKCTNVWQKLEIESTDKVKKTHPIRGPRTTQGRGVMCEDANGGSEKCI